MRFIPAVILASIASTFLVTACAQQIVANPAGFQTIAQPSGTSFDVVGGPIVIGITYKGDASLQIAGSLGCCGRFTQMDPNGHPSQSALNIMASSDASGNADWFSWGVNNGAWTINPGLSFGNSFVVSGTGSVGIGTATPGASLEVNGNVKLSAGSGASITFADATVQSTAWNGVLFGGDYAESVNVSGDREEYQPGDVLVIDPDTDGKFLKSSGPYSTTVTGIYSTRPGVIGRRQLTARAQMKEEVPMAMTGIVPTKVSTENGPIKPGDLLVTSSKPGYAMKGTDRSQMLGAVIGKAIGHLDSGTGVIEAVVTLQ